MSHHSVVIMAHQPPCDKCLGREMNWETLKVLGRRVHSLQTQAMSYHFSPPLGWSINICLLGLRLPVSLLHWIGSQSLFWMLSQDPPLTSASSYSFTVPFLQLLSLSFPKASRSLEETFPVKSLPILFFWKKAQLGSFSHFPPLSLRLQFSDHFSQKPMK